jgi:hypothetical protein
MAQMILVEEGLEDCYGITTFFTSEEVEDILFGVPINIDTLPPCIQEFYKKIS